MTNLVRSRVPGERAIISLQCRPLRPRSVSASSTGCAYSRRSTATPRPVAPRSSATPAWPARPCRQSSKSSALPGWCTSTQRPKTLVRGAPDVRLVLLSLVPGAAFAAGVDFGHQHIRVAICDLSGRPVIDDWSPAEVDNAPTQSLDLANELVPGGPDEHGDRARSPARSWTRRRGTDQHDYRRARGRRHPSRAGTASGPRPRWSNGLASPSSSTMTRTSAHWARRSSGSADTSTISSTCGFRQESARG